MKDILHVYMSPSRLYVSFAFICLLHVYMSPSRLYVTFTFICNLHVYMSPSRLYGHINVKETYKREGYI